MHGQAFRKAYLHLCHLLAGQPLQVGQLQQVIHLHALNALVQVLHPSAAASQWSSLQLHWNGQHYSLMKWHLWCTHLGAAQVPVACQWTPNELRYLTWDLLAKIPK